MHWTKEYLSPLTRKEKISIAIKKVFKDYITLVPFALHPHTEIKPPFRDIPEIKGIEETGMKAIEKIYDASLSRIDNLEKKAFTLLSYITASFTIIALLYTLFSDYSLRVWLLVPIGTLLLTLFISFRCLSVKSIFQVFVGDIYRFDSDNKPITTGEELHLNYLRSAIHNEAKADETADMLRASRMLLVTSMLFLFIVVGLMMAHGTDPKLPREEDIQLKAINHSLMKMDSSLICISKDIIKIDEQKQRIDSLATQVQELKKEMRKKSSKGQK